MNHIGTKSLETDRLILRRFNRDDAGAFFSNVTSDAEVNKYLTWDIHKSVEETEHLMDTFVERYRNADRYCWAVELKETKELIGTVAAPTVKERTETVEITYCFGSRWWGHGYATESLTAVMNFFFDEVGVNRVEAGHDLNNPASGRVMEKAGLKKEGILIQAGRNNCGLFDLVMYGRVR